MAPPPGLSFGSPTEEASLSSFEYTVIPAPLRSEKAKATKDPSERYALTLSEAINRMAQDGWEYLRAETLPSEERSGLTGRTTLFHNLLIFRRPTASHAAIAVGEATQQAAGFDSLAPATPQIVSASDTPAAAAGPATEEPSPVFSEKMRGSEARPEDAPGETPPTPLRPAP